MKADSSQYKGRYREADSTKGAIGKQTVKLPEEQRTANGALSKGALYLELLADDRRGDGGVDSLHEADHLGLFHGALVRRGSRLEQLHQPSVAELRVNAVMREETLILLS